MAFNKTIFIISFPITGYIVISNTLKGIKSNSSYLKSIIDPHEIKNDIVPVIPNIQQTC